MDGACHVCKQVGGRVFGVFGLAAQGNGNTAVSSNYCSTKLFLLLKNATSYRFCNL